MFHTKFEASEPSGTEEEDFEYFLCISKVQTNNDPGAGQFGP